MTNKTETSYASLLIPPMGVVQGTAPTLSHDEEGPQVIFLSEEAKSIKFQLDPSAVRVVVYPSGRVDHEY